MNWEKVKKVFAFIISMLIALSMLYLVYWKTKILFKY